MKNDQKACLYILLGCLIWALDLLVRIPLTQKHNFIELTFVESLMGLVFTLPLFLKRGTSELRKLSLKHWIGVIFLGGVGMTVAGFLSNLSLMKSTPALFSVVQMLQPILVLLMASLFLKEKVDSLYFYGGLWIILSGLMIYSQDFSFYLDKKLEMNGVSLLVAILTMLIWAGCTIISKFLLTNISPFALLCLRWIFAFVFSVCFLFYQRSSLNFDFITDWSSYLRLIFMSGVAGSLGMYFYYLGLKNLTAIKTSFLELSFPTFGVMLWSFYRYEEVSLLRALGILFFFSFVLILLSNFNQRQKN